MAERFFGVDGEMSSNTIADGHRLIQIGVAVDTTPDGSRLDVPELFASLVGWSEGELPWDDRAASIHRIPRADVLAAPRADVVDARLHDWLVEHGAHEDWRADQVMVGFNVGAFDAPFISQALPRSFSLFSRRYGDLNPLCFALGHAVSLSGGSPSPTSWRRYLRRVGLRKVQLLGREEAEHDAGTDALLALAAWREVESILSGLQADAARQRRADREERIAAVDGARRPSP
ncbi:MAG: hypothetical protein QM714_08400 [Nocardioides sp.]|uniref:hypothetical protein n=1 Tax=Nocardioides sp. TaxID=35761 RepID=UPI0039E3253A